jgi:3-oxoacyl-[acyl-carrier-protein] synthase II
LSRRVVITGTGSISSLGSNSNQLWKNLVSGKSGISLLKKINTESLSVKIGGEISDYDSNNFFEEKDSKKLDLFSQYALIAADQAIQHSQFC